MFVELQKQWGHIMAKNAILGTSERFDQRGYTPFHYSPWSMLISDVGLCHGVTW